MGPPRKPTPKHAATAKAIVDDAYRGADKRRRLNPKTRPKSSPRTSDDIPATKIATSPHPEKAIGPPKRTSTTVSIYVVTTSIL